MTKFNPYLNFEGNTEEAFEFYKSVFGGEFDALIRYKDFPIEGMEVPENARDKVMHVGLPVGDGQFLMGTDAIEGFGQSLAVGNNVYISITPDSREEADRLFSALSEGGQVEMPMAEQPWGDYYGSFTDRFGIRWMIDYELPK